MKVDIDTEIKMENEGECKNYLDDYVVYDHGYVYSNKTK